MKNDLDIEPWQRSQNEEICLPLLKRILTTFTREKNSDHLSSDASSEKSRIWVQAGLKEKSSLKWRKTFFQAYIPMVGLNEICQCFKIQFQFEKVRN